MTRDVPRACRCLKMEPELPGSGSDPVHADTVIDIRSDSEEGASSSLHGRLRVPRPSDSARKRKL